MNKDDALAVYLKNTIPDLVEDDKFSSTGIVVSIPQESPIGSITRHTETAETLFNRTMQYNTNWIREGYRSGDNQHNVSVTISVRDEEWEMVRGLMWESKELYNGNSLLPFNGGTYVQAPFEDCTKEQFEEMSKLVKDIDLTKVVEESDKTERIEILSCAGGVCTIE